MVAIIKIFLHVVLIGFSEGRDYCGTTGGTSSDVEWPPTDNLTLSKPICLDQNREFLFRRCDNGQWDEEPICSYTQFETLPQCPDGYLEAENFCYLLTVESTFPPKCPFGDILSFNTYKEVILENSPPVWVPATRNTTTGLDFIRWSEPTSLYKKEVANYTYSKPVKDKNCLIYSNSTFHLVSCDEKYSGICAYNKIGQITNTTNNLCDSSFSCIQSDFIKKSLCICVTYTVQNTTYEKVEFLESFQNNVIKILTNQTCDIGLEKTSKNKYIWTKSQTEIDYTFWSEDTVFDETHIYGAASSQGWTLIEHPLSCYIYEKNVTIPEPSLKLEFEETTNRFLLSIQNPDSLKAISSEILLFCFTDSNSLHLLPNYNLKIVQNTRDNILYEFYALTFYSGTTWCEGFKYGDETLIKSEEVFVDRSSYSEFVAVFEINYDEEINPLSGSGIEFVRNSLFPILETSSDIRNSYRLNIIKIEELDEENNKITVNVHISGIKNAEDNDNEQTFLKSEIAKNLNSSELYQVVLLKISNSNFCPAISDFLTWPKTKIGTLAAPEEFCFTSDATPVRRPCKGSFIDGAEWQEYESCEIFEKSIITDQLAKKNQNFSRSDCLIQIYNISINYQLFQPVDVYLIADFYNNLIDVPNIEIIASTINNLLKIDRDILRESQLRLRATDKLLLFLSNNKNDSEVKIILDKFVFISSDSGKLTGLAVISKKEKFDVEILRGAYGLENLTEIENLDSAIWLSQNFLQNIPKNTTITFSLYFEDVFFQQTLSLESGVIFGLINPKSADLFQGAVNIIYRREFASLAETNCAYWSYSESDEGQWTLHGKPVTADPFLFCEFWQSGNFALIRENIGQNVTDSLEDLLNSNNTAADTISQLSEILQKHDFFDSLHVQYTADILEKVSNEDVDLEDFTKIVSNLQEVDPKVLFQSQLENHATDKILSNIDIIALKSSTEETVQTVAENFLILSVNYTKNFNGFVLLADLFGFKIDILTDNSTIEDVVEIDSFDSAVILSQDLKTQIDENSKIVFTVFLKDSLFNDRTGKKPSNKIFGVILPEISEYLGSITIFYKSEIGEEEQECVHWNYTFEDSWIANSKVKILPKCLQCDFWHTTHFTYLITGKKKNEDQSGCLDSLDILTSVNCMFSLFGLSCIILTAVLFQNWRQNTGNQILLNFTFAIVLEIIAFYISTSITDVAANQLFCLIIGVLLHYSIVAQFCWMLVLALLQYRKFVIVLEGPPKSVLLKSCVCGWVLPLLPVAGLLAIQKDNYTQSKFGFCYPSDYGLYLGVWLPVSLIIAVNFVLFAITVYNIIIKKSECFNGGSLESLYQWRLAILLFFLLGFTWTFGFLAELDFGLVFEYLFCMTATLQGFILFLFFIVFNSNTRYLYAKAIGNFCKKKSK